MASPNWNIADVVAGQDNAFAFISGMIAQIDRASNDPADRTISGASNTFTATEWEDQHIVNCVGTPGVAWNLDALNATSNMVKVVSNSTDGVGTLRNSVGGGTTVAIPVGVTGIYSYDGTDWVAIVASPHLIDDLSDVDTTTSAPTTGDHLVFDGTDWVPQADEFAEVTWRQTA
jgi:hypothetical protein